MKVAAAGVVLLALPLALAWWGRRAAPAEAADASWWGRRAAPAEAADASWWGRRLACPVEPTGDAAASTSAQAGRLRHQAADQPVAVRRPRQASGSPAVGDAPGLVGAARVLPLEAGTSLVLVPDHRVPLVAVRLEFPVGTWSEWARERPLEEAWAAPLYDPDGELRRRADALGVTLDLGSGPRSCWLATSCLAEDLPAVLDLARDVLANRELEASELKRRRHARRLRWKALQSEPSFRVHRAAALRLFQEGDPRRLPWVEPPKLERRPKRLLPVRDAVVRWPGRLVGLAGAVDAAAAAELARGLLPPAVDEPPGDGEPRFAGPTAERAEPVRVHLRRLPQVYLALARPAPPLGHPDYPAFIVADHVLGGHFYSRLSVALRHQGGETYGAGTIRRIEEAASLYELYTYTRADNAGVARVKLATTLETFHRDGVTAEEVRDAASFLRGRAAFAVQAPAQVLERSHWELVRGFGLGARLDLLERAARLDPAEVNRFITRFYDPAAFVPVAVEPEE